MPPALEVFAARNEPVACRIAERLVEAQQTAAMLTTFNEVDMSEVMRLRKLHKEAFAERHGVGLGFMSFFVKACCEALRRHEGINAYIDGQEVEYHDYCDVSVAVGTPKGLVVPFCEMPTVFPLLKSNVASKIWPFAT